MIEIRNSAKPIILAAAVAAVVGFGSSAGTATIASAGVKVDLSVGSGFGRGWRPHSSYSHCFTWLKKYKQTRKSGYLFKYHRCLRHL